MVNVCIPLTALGLANQTIFKESKQRFTCTNCNNVMLEVKQLECGHLLCGTCVDILKTCPIPGCNKLVEKVNLDRWMTREIRSFQLNCKHAEYGCQWNGQLVKYLDHFQNCKYQKEHGTADHVSQHLLQGQCINKPPPLRLIKCQYCKIEMKESEFENHNESCEYFPVKCIYCGQDGFKRPELWNHHHYDCPEAEISCEFADIGCPEIQGKKKEEAWDHKRIANVVHLNLFLQYFMSFRRECHDEFSGCHSRRKKIQQLETTFEKLENSVKSFTIKFDEFNPKAVMCKVNSTEEKISSLEKSLKEKSNKQERDLKLYLQRADSTDIKIRDIEAMLGCLQDDGLLTMPRGENKSVKALECRVAEMEKTITKFQKQVAKYEEVTSSYDRLLALQEAKILSMENQLVEKESGTVPSNDGILIWKITNFAEKRYDAITKNRTNVLSPCFYSGQRGYKMRARIYLNGDGLGKNSYISLFFTVLQGPHDALLPWPFRQKIKLMILDQNNVQHAVDSFNPDPTNTSFQRPKSESNVSSGSPLFLPLETLDRFAYVRDNCMFVKIVVDQLTI